MQLSTQTDNPQLEAMRALAKARAEFPPLPKDKVNPHFKSKYTSIDAIAERIEPILEAHGFLWTTLPGIHEKGPCLHYSLLHLETGGGIEGCMSLMLDKANPQGQGSAITYARRYALVAVLNLQADEDDDGNAGSSLPAAKPSPKPKPQPVKDKAPTELPPTAESKPEIAKAVGTIKASGMEASAVRLKLVSLGVEDPKNLESALAKLSAEQLTDLLKWVKGGNE